MTATDPQGAFVSVTAMSATELADDAGGSPAAERVGGVTIALYRPSLVESLRQARENLHVARGLFSSMLGFNITRTVLGGWWLPITFVFDTFVKSVVFGRILNAPSPTGLPYFLFLGAGNLTWWLFHRGTLYSMKSFYRMRYYVNAFDFPLLFIPLAGIVQLATGLLFTLAIEGIGFVVFYFIDGKLYLNVAPELLLAPVALLWIALLVAAWGFFAAPIYWRARDILHVYKLAIPFVLYTSPVIYPVKAVPGVWGILARLNPLAAPIELFKRSLLGIGGVPLYSVGVSLAFTVVGLVAGLLFLNRYSLRLVGLEPEEDVDDE